MEYLVVRLREDPASTDWAVFDDEGRVVRRAETGALADAADAADGRRVIVLAPAVDIITTQTVLPRTSPAKLRKMLPYSLEDALAEDVENLVFAVGPRVESGAVSVAVVARTRLEAWLEKLAAHGLTAHALYAESDGVPDTPSTLTLVVEDARIFGRVGGEAPFVFDDLGLGQVIGVAAGSTELQHAVVYLDEPANARFDGELDALHDALPSLQVKLMADGALHRLAATVTQRPGTNLLQGEYAPKSNVSGLLTPWRVAASLLAGVLLLGVLATGAEYLSLRQQDQALTQTLTEACRRDFAAPALNACEAAVRSRLAASGMLDDGGAEQFLLALTAIGEARVPNSRIERLSYRDDVVDMQLVVPNVPALDTLVQRIRESERFAVEILSTNVGNGQVEGRVQLRGVAQ